MQLITKTLPPNHDIITSGCWHSGSLLTHWDGLDEMREYILASPDTYLAIGGDLAEAIMVDDKRFNFETDRGEQPLKQYQVIIDYLQPLAKADRVLFCLIGNHDFKLIKFGNFVRDMVCKELNIPYGSYTTKLSVKDDKGKEMWKLYYTHGRKSITSVADDPIRRLANMKLILKRNLSPMAADCIVQAKGHSHKLIVCEPETSLYLYDDGKKVKSSYTGAGEGSRRFIPPDARWYLNTGSFYRLYSDEPGISGYAEMAEYAPVELGYPIIECRDGKVVNVRKVVVG
jgi:hypothetical protein